MKKKKRNKKSGKDGTFTLAAKRFIISCMLILSLTGLAAGIAYADGNSRKMAVGERGSTVALAHREKQLELSINEKTAATFNLSVQGLSLFSARSAERYRLARRPHSLTASFSASAPSGVTKAVLYTW